MPVGEADLEVIRRRTAELVLEVIEQGIGVLSGMTGACLAASNGLEADVGNKKEPGTQVECAFACVLVRHFSSQEQASTSSNLLPACVVL